MTTWVVTAESPASAAAAAAAVERTGGDVSAVLGHVDAVVTTMDAADAARIAARPGVLDVEPDATYRVSDLPSRTQSPAPWHLDRLDQAAPPLDGAYTSASTGAGVTAYVIDSGVRATHVDLTGRVATGFDATGGGSTGDCDGHGTHVAGLLGGTTYGVAKQVTIVPVRVTDCAGEASLSDVLAGIDWVTAHHDPGTPAVANMSLGGDASTALDHAVEASIASGITYVVAAGHDGGDACLGSPADVPEALTVGASDTADRRASFSDHGSCVDLFAPGSAITSDWSRSDTDRAVASGTSMASPLVAGAAVLVLSRHPSATPAEVARVVLGESTSGAVADARGPSDAVLGTSASGSGAEPVTALGGAGSLPSGALRDVGTATGRDVARVAGADRYATSAQVSAAAFPSGAPRVYLARGSAFPDGLSSAAAAGSTRVPVLLVGPGGLTAPVLAELTRLAPSRVSAVGGPDVVPDAVLAQARAATGAVVDRLAGPDRYATAVAVAVDAHPSTTTVYLACGTGFPDALSASSAAARQGSVLLLTAPERLSDPTRAELARLRPTRLVVVGGADVVSDAVAADAAAVAGVPATRLSGPDRYATAAAVLADGPHPRTLQVATGQDFPDALAGAAAAGALGDAMVIVPPGGLTGVLRDEVAAATRG